MEAYGLLLLCSSSRNDVLPLPQWNVSITAVTGPGSSIQEAYGRMGTKSCSNDLDHMTKMAAMPIYGKTLKNLHLRDQ